MKRDAIDFGSDSIPKLFRKIFIPTIIGMACMAVMTTIDGVFVGHGIGSDALAAVNIFAPFWMIMTGLGLLFGIGCSVVASIHLSQGNEKAARINMTQTLLFGILLTGALTLIVHTHSTGTAYLLGSSDRLLPYVLDYQKWLAFAFCALFLQSVGLLIIRLDGSPKYASAAAALPSVINVVLDYVFLFVLHKGLEGIAIATMIGCWTGGLMVIFYILFLSKTMRLYPLKLSWKSLCLSARNLWYQFRLGISAFLGEISVSMLMFTGNYVFMKYLGEDGVAAFSIACYIMPFIFMTGNAISQSAQPIISFNYGTGSHSRVAQARRVSLLTALGLGIIISLALAFGIKYVAALFLSKDVPAYSIAAGGVPLMAVGFTLSIINVAAIGYYQSVERALPATIFSLSRGVVFLVPCFILLPLAFGVPGIWLALPAAEALTLALIACYRFLGKRNK
jgi:Na+-driven multidrug efflux pump